MRYPVSVAIAFLAAVFVLSTAEQGLPAGGDKTTDNLKKEVSQLQQQVTQLQNTNNQNQTTQKNLNAIINGYKGAGLIHVVILKVRPDGAEPSDSPSDQKKDKKKDAKYDPKAEVQSLINDSYSQLAKISSVRGLWAGKPSASGTPDANTDYSAALVLVFDDSSSLKNYLNDPAHTKFADKHLKYYDTPVVFDLEPRKAQP